MLWFDSLSWCAELFAVYVLVVSRHMFAAQLVDMRAPRVHKTSVNPATSWPNGADSVSAIAKSLMTILSTSMDETGATFQCSYCGKGWNSKSDDRKQKPKVGFGTLPVQAAVSCIERLYQQILGHVDGSHCSHV